MRSYISSLKSLALALILVGGVSAASAANTWTAPTVAAPNGNVDAPINVSPVTQFKKGGIVIEGLNASNEILAFPFSVLNGNVGIGTSTPSKKLSVIGSVQIKDGTEGAGKVLTSDANGVASWAVASGGTGGTTTPTTFVSSVVTFPVSTKFVQEFNHGLGRTPYSVRWVFVCSQSTCDGGYKSGDEVDVLGISSSYSTSFTAYSYYSNTTKVGITRYCNVQGGCLGAFAAPITGGTWVNMQSGQWKLKAYAN